MKKIVILLLVSFLIISGCTKDQDYPNDSNPNNRTNLSYPESHDNVYGSWIEDPNNNSGSMVGFNVAEKLDLNVGDYYSIIFSDTFENGFNETVYSLVVTGIIQSGGNEDDQVFVNLHVAQNITSRNDKVHTVQVSALCNACPVDTFAEEIEGKISNTDARTVKQLVNAEMNILGKIENMMFMVTIIALLASALGVMTTMTTNVIERCFREVRRRLRLTS